MHSYWQHCPRFARHHTVEGGTSVGHINCVSPLSRYARPSLVVTIMIGDFVLISFIEKVCGIVNFTG